MAALFPPLFPTLKVTDFFQNGETAGWAVGAIAAMTVGAGAALDLSESNLQAGQRMLKVRVSVFPVLVLRSC